jgi:signal transduction histidine kinase/DNA-binding response OmpR family regulator
MTHNELNPAAKEIQQAKEDLKISQERLNLALESGRIGIWTWDIIDDDFYFEEQFCSIFKTTSKSFNRRFNDFLLLVDEVDRDQVSRYFQQSVEGGDDIEFEFHGDSLKNAGKVFKIRGKAYRDVHEKVTKLTGVCWDVTDQLERQRSLVEAKDKAEEIAKLKARFLATMGHEIHTPINGMMGMITLLKEHKLGGKEKKLVDVLERSTNNLLRIINDVLDHSKLESGKFHLSHESFYFPEILEDVITTYQYQAIEEGVTLSYEIDKNVPEYINSDPSRISQIFCNLVGNALKFTHKGYVKVKVSASSFEGDKFRLHVSVEDTGIGISEKDIPKLFHSFTQLDSSESRRYEGTGLGLVIVKQLCQQLGGDVTVDSVLGKGSCFLFSIEAGLVKDVEKLQKSHSLASVFDLQLGQRYPLNILVAEDSNINQLITRSFLEKFGYQPEVVDNGKEALDRIEKNNYDVVFMDVHMPEMGGVECTRLIREKYGAHGPYIISFTANSFEEDRQKYLSLGMDDYVCKPITPQSIKKVIEQAIHTIRDKNPTLEEYFCGNTELLKKFIDSFEATYPNLLEDLEKAIRNKNFETIKHLAHSLSGMTAYFGNQKLQGLLRKIQEAKNEQQLQDASLHFQECQLLIERIHQGLIERFKKGCSVCYTDHD